MNDGFQFIDIIFFAMVAAFLVLRLRSVLGRRTGNERQQPDPLTARQPQEREAAADNVVELPNRRQAEVFADGAAATPSSAGITQIRVADPTFTPEGFTDGARAAFAMIVGAFAAADTDALRPLLSDEVYGNFSAAVDQRRNAGETLETELVSIKSATIDEAHMEARVAFVTVKFVSEQVNVVRNEAGEVVEGDPNRVAEVTDLWTFARNTASRDPNWTLVATRSPDEA